MRVLGGLSNRAAHVLDFRILIDGSNGAAIDNTDIKLLENELRIVYCVPFCAA